MNSLIREGRHFKKNAPLFLLGLPALFALILVYYVPMFGLVIAFKNYSYDLGIWKSPWAGLKNFEFFFTSEDAFRVTRNTLLLNGSFIIISFAAAIVVALMLNDLKKREIKLFQTVLFIPYFISWIVVGYLLYGFLAPNYGIVNTVLKSFNLAPVDWYSEPAYWPAILIICYLWKNVGYLTIIFYTGILGIDSTYYEAASIDGASRFQQARMITIPLIRPLIILMLILSIGKIFYSDFGLFFFVPREMGQLLPATDVIDTYVYRSLRVVGDLGMASAAGFYQSIVGFVLVMASNLVIRKIDRENAVF